jgi:uncharacterized protein (DUF342 family)
MAKRDWALEENPKNKRWYLSIPEGLAEEGYPSVEDIKFRASEKGIDPNKLCSDATLEKNLAKARALLGEEFSFPVVIEPTFDVRLTVSQDKTKATLYIRKASDRRDYVDLRLVSAAINNSQVKGIDVERLKEKINAFSRSPVMELEDYVLAEGKPSGRGKDRALICKVEWLPDSEAAEIAARVGAGEKRRYARAAKDQILFELSPVETGEPGTDVYGKEIPGLPGNDPYIQLGEGVTIGPAGVKAERAGLLVAAGDDDSALSVSVLPYQDGKATVIVSNDNQTASIILEAEEGHGRPLTVEMATAALEEKKIRGNIKAELIPDAVAEVRASRKSREIVVLRGSRPVTPNGYRVVNFTEIPETGKTVNVTVGDRILSLQKLPVGSDGIDVFGNALKASTAGHEDAPEHDDTIEEASEGDVTVFKARVAGELSLHGTKWSVSDTRSSTGDVDDKIGDIDFPGNLVLTGNVLNGRSVKAAGNLTVNGSAGASLVQANGTLSMAGGIKGAGRGTAWARQEIALGFAENARVLAGQNITIEKYCFQCMVKTGGQLIMKGTPGVLLGGSVRASKGIEVYELGSDKTIRTVISFGQNYLVGDQIEVCERESEKIRETVERLNTEMKKLSNTDPRIQELRRRKLELLKRNDKLTVRVFTLKEQFETHILSHVRVENTVYPGVVLESHGRYYEVRKMQNHVIFAFDQRTGQITCRPID